LLAITNKSSYDVNLRQISICSKKQSTQTDYLATAKGICIVPIILHGKQTTIKEFEIGTLAMNNQLASPSRLPQFGHTKS
jgi:uncharacterized membrane protein YcfT